MFTTKLKGKVSKMLIQSKTKFENIPIFNTKNNASILVNKNIKYSPVKNVLNKTGFKPTSKIAKTLQGSVYNAVNSNGIKCVLKRTSVQLHDMGIARVNNKFYKVKENIINEAKIMKYLTSINPVKGLPKFIDFFSDGKNYFLLMEHGGQSLLDHVRDFHQKIKNNKIKLKIWKQHVKILFKQMCIFINWLHNIARFVHLDISLENMLIKGCEFKNGKFISHGQIYFIDFGLAKCYANKKSFDNCTKYVGKISYQAPEVYHKRPFNAAKADVWSLGIVLFMMIIGACPYLKPTKSDKMFINICNGYTKQWMNDVGKSEYISESLIDLFDRIFCDEMNRLYIQDIMKHDYLK